MALKSSDVFVFPCVSREAPYDLNAKVLSEKNITNIIKSIADNESYILNWDSNKLRCVVRGYYFEITVSKPSTGNLYAHLQFTDGRDDLLDGDDSNYTFKGLVINNNSINSDLDLWVDGKIPPNSFTKFNLQSIDCGELN